MKIARLEDIDLSKYRIAYAQSNIRTDYDSRSQNEINKVYEIEPEEGYDKKTVEIVLIPRNKRISDCDGEEWGKKCTPGWIDTYPKGTIFLRGTLGQQLMVSDK